MPPLLTSLATRLTRQDAFTQRGIARIAPVAAFHLAPFAIMLWSELGLFDMAVFALSWGLVNCFWLVLLRRPAQQHEPEAIDQAPAQGEHGHVEKAELAP